jgi:hypothetical protein
MRNFYLLSKIWFRSLTVKTLIIKESLYIPIYIYEAAILIIGITDGPDKMNQLMGKMPIKKGTRRCLFSFDQFRLRPETD